MGKKRTQNKHLPRRMYLNHGAYYYVDKNNKWIKLSKEYPLALAKWAQIEGSNENNGLLNAAILKYKIEELPLLAKSTQKTNTYHIARLENVFGQMPINDIKTAHIKQYLTQRTAKVSANREIAVLSAIFTCALNWGWCQSNPCYGVKTNKEKKRTRYLSDEEIIKLKHHADETYKCLIDMAYLTSSRISDLLNIKLTNINDKHLTIIQIKTGFKQKYILTPELSAIIKRAKKSRKKLNITHLFTNKHAQQITKTGFNSAMRRLIDKTGLKDVHFHDIRAKSLTDAKALRGLDYAQLLGGHTNQSQTESYIKNKEYAEVLPLK